MTRARVLMLAALACLVVAAGCATSRTEADSAVSQTLLAAGLTREYLLYQPANLPSGKVPLMIALHPGSSTGQAMENLTGFDALADRKGFIVAYPDAQTGAEKGNWQLGCCSAARESPEDVEFIAGLIDHLVSSDNVDPRRVYVTGFSVGAGMTYRLACQLSSKIAGIGSVGGYEYLSTPCAPDRPLAVYEIHGTRDFYGGSCGGHTETDEGCSFGEPGYIPSVVQLDEQWRHADGCPATGASETFGTITRQTWEPCLQGSGVRLDTNQGGEHCWPTPTTCGEFDATEAFWEFLSTHQLANVPSEGEGETEGEGGGETETEGEGGGGNGGGGPAPGSGGTPPGGPPAGGSPGSGGAASTTNPPAGSTPAITAPGPSLDVVHRCRVPQLLGHSASQARRLVAHARCSLGHIARLRGRGRLVVRAQTPRAGTLHADRAKVRLVLGPRLSASARARRGSAGSA